MVKIFCVIGAFGIRGALRVFSFSQRLSCYKNINDKNGNRFLFRVVRFLSGNKAIVSINGVNDRNAAEAFRNRSFYVNRSDLPKINANEAYVCDLIEKEVSVSDSDIKCKIVNVANFGAGDLIEVSYENDTFFVPFTSENFKDCGGQFAISLEAFYGFKN